VSIYGYYDSPAQDKPTFDPGIDVNCPSCGLPLEPPLKTISLMLYDRNRGDRSYFYRTHKACYDALDEKQKGALDGLLIDAISSIRNTN
jgi:hypothetical protein